MVAVFLNDSNLGTKDIFLKEKRSKLASTPIYQAKRFPLQITSRSLQSRFLNTFPSLDKNGKTKNKGLFRIAENREKREHGKEKQIREQS